MFCPFAALSPAVGPLGRPCVLRFAGLICRSPAPGVTRTLPAHTGPLEPAADAAYLMGGFAGGVGPWPADTGPGGCERRAGARGTLSNDPASKTEHKLARFGFQPIAAAAQDRALLRPGWPWGCCGSDVCQSWAPPRPRPPSSAHGPSWPFSLGGTPPTRSPEGGPRGCPASGPQGDPDGYLGRCRSAFSAGTHRLSSGFPSRWRSEPSFLWGGIKQIWPTRAYAQQLVTTRLLDCLHDPVGRPSRLQGIHPGAQ